VTTAVERLTAEARTRTSANRRPVDAATLILVDDTGASPKILMGRRNPAMAFMPGKFVFPGGRVDPADRRLTCAGLPTQTCLARLARRVVRPSDARARALALAAIRETFEETGYLIGRPAPGPATVLPPEWREFADAGLYPAPGALTFVARAITPPRRPRRFDTRFFAASLRDAPHRVPRALGPDAELTELVWVGLDEAARLDLPAITQVILEEVRERLRGGLSGDAPVPFYHERRRVFLREEV
jgi:8-oxo-dGTP pyrophosphatase MutT (NUDIX family)